MMVSVFHMCWTYPYSILKTLDNETYNLKDGNIISIQVSKMKWLIISIEKKQLFHRNSCEYLIFWIQHLGLYENSQAR